MNGYSFRYGKYMNGSVFKLRPVYEWGGFRGLQPHVHTQNNGKLPPCCCSNRLYGNGFKRLVDIPNWSVMKILLTMVKSKILTSQRSKPLSSINSIFFHRQIEFLLLSYFYLLCIIPNSFVRFDPDIQSNGTI